MGAGKYSEDNFDYISAARYYDMATLHTHNPEDRKKLFSPFFTTKPHGSGLALASGRKMLRDHGGDLGQSS